MLDGRPVQKATTSDLCFDVATLLAHASDLKPVEPGNLITTGTPGGTLAHPLHPTLTAFQAPSTYSPSSGPSFSLPDRSRQSASLRAIKWFWRRP